MAKEPAGLRRWRLAHRKKKRVRRYTVAKRRRRYSRRGRKGKGRRSSKAIPLLKTMIVAEPIIQAYRGVGLSTALPREAVFNLTGYHVTNRTFDQNTAIKVGGALLLATFIGGPIARKSGANRLMKKLSMGYLKVA